MVANGATQLEPEIAGGSVCGTTEGMAVRTGRVYSLVSAKGAWALIAKATGGSAALAFLKHCGVRVNVAGLDASRKGRGCSDLDTSNNAEETKHDDAGNGSKLHSEG